MPISNMAKILARSGNMPRRMSDRPERKPREAPQQQQVAERPTLVADAFHPVPKGEESNPQSVYTIPDSWVAPKSVHAEPVPDLDPERSRRPGPPLKPRHKRRKNSVSISVSEEEEFYLRQYASQRGLSFSEWVRVTLFKAMGRKVPDRPEREGA